MKNGMKLFAFGAAVLTAAIGVTAYHKYRDSKCGITNGEENVDELFADADFEPIVEMEDDFTYYLEDADQIMFYE